MPGLTAPTCEVGSSYATRSPLRPRRGRLLVLVALLEGAACAPDESAFAVGVSTDLTVGFELERVTLASTSSEGTSTNLERSYRKGQLRLPSLWALDLEQGGGELALVLSGFAEGAETPLVTKTATVTPLEGRRLLVPLSLDAACIDVACAPGESCEAGSCRSSRIGAERLVELDEAWAATASDACKHAEGPSAFLAIGQGSDAYAPLADGAVLPVEPGPQGGHHVWLALRTSGLRQQGVRAVARGTFPELASELPAYEVDLTQRRGPGGTCEIHGLRFQVDRSLPLASLRGRRLDVAITLADRDGTTASAGRSIVIAPE